MTVWQWASMNNSSTLKQKQLCGILSSVILLFTRVLFLLSHVNSCKLKLWIATQDRPTQWTCLHWCWTSVVQIPELISIWSVQKGSQVAGPLYGFYWTGRTHVLPKTDSCSPAGKLHLLFNLLCIFDNEESKPCRVFLCFKGQLNRRLELYCKSEVLNLF